MDALNALEDDAKVEYAIECVATGQPLPKNIEAFLREEDLYDLIVEPWR